MTDARFPTCRRQQAKPYDRAFVELNGRRLYLVRWGTPESQERYRRTITRWLASGCQGETD
ncbi:MAG: hypothetical protein JNK25_03815 [Phycisphaerae bacterium]|nr:hypothetical protein [Phycisphaerae bacterium]